MTNNPFEWIRENQIELDARDNKLRKKEKQLSLLVPEQNNKFEKLRNGYKELGLVTDEDDRNQEPMTRDRFWKEYEALQNWFNNINLQSVTKEEKFKVQNELEQYLSKMMALVTNRWNTNCAFKELWKKERYEFRQKELKLCDKYSELAKEKDNSMQQEWVELADKLFIKNKNLIEEQKKKLYREEELLKELEILFELREKLFKLAVQLFKI